MKIALLGYSGSGKTSLVAGISGKRHESFDPLKPAIVCVKINDSRLRAISDIVKPQKSTESEITFVDIKGAPESTGFDEKTIEIALAQDRIGFVVPTFSDERNPVNELDSLYLEMVYRDMERIKNILDKRNYEILHGKRKKSVQEECLEKCLGVLEEEKFLSSVELDYQQKVFLNSLGLITVKYCFVIGCGKFEESLFKECQRYNLRMCNFELDAEDKNYIETFWKQFLVAAGLLRFYTIVGKEAKAWLLPENSSVLDAAATIHTDIAAGFVRAEVVRFEDFISHGSFSACREKGLLRSEAKTGIVNDGDIIHIHSTR